MKNMAVIDGIYRFKIYKKKLIKIISSNNRTMFCYDLYQYLQ